MVNTGLCFNSGSKTQSNCSVFLEVGQTRILDVLLQVETPATKLKVVAGWGPPSAAVRKPHKSFTRSHIAI